MEQRRQKLKLTILFKLYIKFLNRALSLLFQRLSTPLFQIQDAETSLPAKIQLEHFGELLVGQSILLSGKKVCYSGYTWSKLKSVLSRSNFSFYLTVNKSSLIIRFVIFVK